jgi:hypothetical protein
MIKRYLINAKNSTVCGYPGTHFDWTKFDWNQKESYDYVDMRYSTESEFVPDNDKGQLIGVKQSPIPWIDGKDKEYYEYLHVPFNWAEDATIYRVRPHFEVGQTRWKHKVIRVSAINDNNIWYWEIELQ